MRAPGPGVRPWWRYMRDFGSLDPWRRVGVAALELCGGASIRGCRDWPIVRSPTIDRYPTRANLIQDQLMRLETLAMRILLATITRRKASRARRSRSLAAQPRASKNGRLFAPALHDAANLNVGGGGGGETRQGSYHVEPSSQENSQEPRAVGTPSYAWLTRAPRPEGAACSPACLVNMRRWTTEVKARKSWKVVLTGQQVRPAPAGFVQGAVYASAAAGR
jgi:hypothetical protein